MLNAQQIKERIIEEIKNKGPLLHTQAARAINLSPLFTSAFLSEIYREGKIMMSHMKIGSSSLYIIPGQEIMLEKFTEHLNQREREAFQLLREKKILKDEEQTPVIRVALRA